MPMTLRDARIAAQAVKVFVQNNQAVEVMHGYLKPIEDLVSDLEAMTVSVRTQQTRVHNHNNFFAPVKAADGRAPSAGSRAQ